MEGNVCLITGGNAGIGKTITVGLAQQGATVVIMARGGGLYLSGFIASGRRCDRAVFCGCGGEAEYGRVIRRSSCQKIMGG